MCTHVCALACGSACVCMCVFACLCLCVSVCVWVWVAHKKTAIRMTSMSSDTCEQKEARRKKKTHTTTVRGPSEYHNLTEEEFSKSKGDLPNLHISQYQCTCFRISIQTVVDWQNDIGSKCLYKWLRGGGGGGT